jgi:hypothetical protein
MPLQFGRLETKQDEIMLDIDVKSEYLENEERLCNKVTEILLILTNAEKQGQNLYSPFKQIDRVLNDLQDEYILNLYQRLLNGFHTATTHEQTWADDYFTFILQLCNLLNKTRAKVNQDNLSNNVVSCLVPA